MRFTNHKENLYINYSDMKMKIQRITKITKKVIITNLLFVIIHIIFHILFNYKGEIYYVI
jgi:hypothetical protein